MSIHWDPAEGLSSVAVKERAGPVHDLRYFTNGLDRSNLIVCGLYAYKDRAVVNQVD